MLSPISSLNGGQHWSYFAKGGIRMSAALALLFVSPDTSPHGNVREKHTGLYFWQSAESPGLLIEEPHYGKERAVLLTFATVVGCLDAARHSL